MQNTSCSQQAVASPPENTTTSNSVGFELCFSSLIVCPGIKIRENQPFEKIQEDFCACLLLQMGVGLRRSQSQRFSDQIYTHPRRYQRLSTENINGKRVLKTDHKASTKRQVGRGLVHVKPSEILQHYRDQIHTHLTEQGPLGKYGEKSLKNRGETYRRRHSGHILVYSLKPFYVQYYMALGRSVPSSMSPIVLPAFRSAVHRLHR